MSNGNHELSMRTEHPFQQEFLEYPDESLAHNLRLGIGEVEGLRTSSIAAVKAWRIVFTLARHVGQQMSREGSSNLMRAAKETFEWVSDSNNLTKNEEEAKAYARFELIVACNYEEVMRIEAMVDGS
ncbi:hypothetical protein LTR37_003351 [Vermiconidia calcicola]|uniref:Uncharacterized protein n=1 Tax=Vermiconidia calcicola TaxID=1690605 RepID=A0ACC3NQG5_9PEZI|nr:hypothetical protein LTR37_003351 [Vermiconidia calcicola]